MLPAKLTPRTTHGFADIMRNAVPLLNNIRAANAVSAKPPPVYLKLSFKYDFSAGERASLVSLFRSPSANMTVPATAAAVIPNLFQASCGDGRERTAESVPIVREKAESIDEFKKLFFEAVFAFAVPKSSRDRL